MGLKRRVAEAMLFEASCSSDSLVYSAGDVYISLQFVNRTLASNYSYAILFFDWCKYKLAAHAGPNIPIAFQSGK